MSEILFKTLTIENFLSIGKGKLELDNRGLLLIQGLNESNPSANSNGAGKSSCVDALCWALYGTTARGLSGDAVVNRFEGKNCRVSVTFVLNGRTYEVVRHRKHKSGKNRLAFNCDGADLTQGTDKLTQEVIEKTIGCSLDVFTASIYAGQNNMPNLPAMTDKELKQLVESAAGIELLDAAYGIARERAKLLENDLSLAIADMNNAHAAVEMAGRQLDDTENTAQQFETAKEAEIERRQQMLTEAVKEAKAQQALVATLDEDALQQNVEEIEAKIATAKKPEPIAAPAAPMLEPLPPPPAMTPLAITSPKLTSLERELDREKATLNLLMSQLREQVDKVQSIEDMVGKPCGECGKPYSEHDLEKVKQNLAAKAKKKRDGVVNQRERVSEVSARLEEERAALQRETEEAIRRNDALQAMHQADCEAVRARNAAAQRAYDEAMQRYREALEAQRNASASREIESLVAALRDAQNALQNAREQRAKLRALLDKVRERKDEWERAKAQPNPYVPLIATQKARIEDLQKKYEEASKVVEERGQSAADAAIVVEMFSPKGIRGEILDSVTPFLNARTAHYLGILSDGTITAEWSTIGETGKGELREKFHIKVCNSDGAEVYEGLSGGEQRKVRISTAMALQDLVASRADRPIKLFVADEVDDALDVSGLERLMTVLDDKAKYVGSVIVISHNDLADWCSNSITVVKEGGKSTLVEI